MQKNVLEEEFSFIDWFWSIIARWRMLLVWMIVFCVLLSGYGYMKNKKEIAALQSQTAYDVSSMDADLRAKAESYNGVIDGYLRQQEFVSNSVMMNLDPNNVPMVTLEYFIDNHFEVEYPIVDKTDSVEDIKNFYKGIINSDSFYQKVIDEFGEEGSRVTCVLPRYVEETANIVFFVYGNNEDECRRLAEIVKEVVGEKEHEVDQKVVEHDMVLVSEGFSQRRDEEFLAYQQNVFLTLENMRLRVSNMRNTTEEAVVTAASKLKQAQNQIEVNTTTLKPRINKKFVLLGVIVGVFMHVMVQTLLYLFDSKLSVISDYYALCKIRSPWLIRYNNKKGIDNLISKLRYKNYPVYEASAWLPVFANMMNQEFVMSDSEQLLVSGQTCNKEFADDIRNALSDKKIQVVCENDFISNSQAMQTVLENKKIILVEQSGVAIKRKVANEVQICRENGVDIVGFIILC